MKFTSALAIAAVTVCAMAGTAANAASTTSDSLSLRLGGFFPSSSEATGLGSTWFTGGLDYALGAQSTGTQQSLLYGDYTEASKNGFKESSLGLGIGFRQNANSLATPTGLFYDTGVGLYFLHGDGDSTSSNATSLGAKLNLGYNVSTNVFVLGGYTWISSKLNNPDTSDPSVDLDGWNAQIGLRF